MVTLHPGGNSRQPRARSLSLASSLLLALTLALTACVPADPLDRRVKASTPAHLSEWWDSVKDDLPDEPRTEAYQLIRYLRDATPRLKSMKADDPYDPFCKRIDSLRLREVMVLAYEAKNDWLRQRVIEHSRDLPKLVEATTTDGPDSLRYVQSRIDYARTFIDQYNGQIAANDRRIAELQPASKP